MCVDYLSNHPLVLGASAVHGEESHRQGKGGEVKPSPFQEIERLKKEVERLERKIKKMQCVADLRRKQKRSQRKQISEMRRGLIVSWKALNGEV